MDSENSSLPQENPEPAKPKCPWCKQVLIDVGVGHNRDSGLITFWHSAPSCMKVLNCQIVPIQRPNVPVDLFRQ